MNINAYIESGILELYALNLLNEAENAAVEAKLSMYEELRQELAQISIALEKHALSNSITPRSELKSLIFDAIENLEKEKIMDPDDLPLITHNSDYRNWLKFISGFGDLVLGEDGKAIQVLQDNDLVTQLLVVSTSDIEQEIHQNEHESFLILSGECKCTIGSRERLMTEGDFMAIPLYEPHDVKLVSPKVTAILQLVKV